MIPIRGLRPPVTESPRPKPKREPLSADEVAELKRIAWTDANVATLQAMWRTNATASQIAAALGVPGARNAVVGKAHRLGLPRRKNPVNRTYGGSRG